MVASSRASWMKALGTASCTALRFTCDSGVWGTVVMIPATRGSSLGSASYIAMSRGLGRSPCSMTRSQPYPTAGFIDRKLDPGWMSSSNIKGMRDCLNRGSSDW